MPLSRTVSQILNLPTSFSHDEFLTTIPSGPITVAKINHPIEAFIEALDAFELSIEIRDRLTRTEAKAFDMTLVPKLHALKGMSVEGPHYSQLKVLKRLTKARVHLKKHFPAMVEDVNKIIWNLLVALGGGAIVSLPLLGVLSHMRTQEGLWSETIKISETKCQIESSYRSSSPSPDYRHCKHHFPQNPKQDATLQHHH